MKEDAPVEGLDTNKSGRVVCSLYREGDPDETFGAHPDQLQLF